MKGKAGVAGGEHGEDVPACDADCVWLHAITYYGAGVDQDDVEYNCVPAVRRSEETSDSPFNLCHHSQRLLEIARACLLNNVLTR